MKVIGKRIFNMDMVLKDGQMAQNMKVFIKMVKSMEKENILGQMDHFMMEIG